MKKVFLLAATTFVLALAGCNGGGDTPKSDPVLRSIATEGAVKTEYIVNDEFVKPTIMATYDDDSTKVVTASTYFTGYNMAIADWYTVTATYAENNISKECQFRIHVAEAGPEEDVYSVTIGDSKMNMTEATPDSGMIAQYHAGVRVTKGQTVSFKLNNEAISVVPSTGENNLVNDNGQLKVHNDAAPADLYLKVYGVYADDGVTLLDTLYFEAWLSGYEDEQQKVDYKAYLGSTEISLVECDKDENMVAQYTNKDTLNVKANDKISFTADNVSISVHATEVDNNNLSYVNNELIVHNDADDVKLYFKVYDSETELGQKWFEAWLSGKEEEPQEEVNYTIKVGDGDAIPMTDVSSEKGQGDTWEKQFKATGVNLVKDATLTFFADGTQIYPGDGNNSKNNVSFDVTTQLLTIKATATDDVYLKLYSDGGYDVWVGGYTEPGQEGITTALTVYFTDNKSWGGANIHYWGDTNTTWPGEAMTKVGQNDYGENIYSYTLPVGTVGFIFNHGGQQTIDLAASSYSESEDGFYLTEKDGNGKWAVGTWNYQPQA